MCDLAQKRNVIVFCLDKSVGIGMSDKSRGFVNNKSFFDWTYSICLWQSYMAGLAMPRQSAAPSYKLVYKPIQVNPQLPPFLFGENSVLNHHQSVKEPLFLVKSHSIRNVVNPLLNLNPSRYYSDGTVLMMDRFSLPLAIITTIIDMVDHE